MINKSPRYFLSNFESIGLSFQEKFKIDFQDGSCGGHLVFQIGAILAIFYLRHLDDSYQVSSQLAFWFRRISQKQIFKMVASWISNRDDFSYSDLSVTPMLPTKVRVNWLFSSGEEAKNRFPWQPSRNSTQNNFFFFSIFDLQVTPKLPTPVQVTWPFGSGKEVNNRYSRWSPWRPSWISDQNDFFFFFIYKSPQCFLPSSVSTGLLVQEKKRKIDFQDGHYSGHLGFPIRKILATFHLQVTSMLPTMFRVSWPFGSGEEEKNRFSG